SFDDLRTTVLSTLSLHDALPIFKSPHNKYWRHVQNLPLPVVKTLGWPFPLDRRVKEDMATADAVLSVGGDNYSLDYLLPSLSLRSEEHTSELQSRENLVCRLLLE